MNTNHKLATLTLALLFPICMSGCGVVARIAKIAMKKGGAVTKMAAGSSDDLARLARVKSPRAGVIVRGTARSAAYVAARGSLKAAASASKHCVEKLSSIPYGMLSPASRVTMRLLIRSVDQNYERLDELNIELNDPSLSDADNERITEEGERVKQDLDRISKKADKLYRELG